MKVVSKLESNWLVKGTYAKFEGIAGRNALIIHRALAAIKGKEPTQLVSAEVLELAIAWTKFELNQTLSQYQILAIDDTNPEQVRMLKFIDKFADKDWITARMVARWWSGRVKPSSKDLRLFMSKVVALGYGISNDRPVDSSEYQIKILSAGSDSSDNKQPAQREHSSPTVTTVTTVTTSKDKKTLKIGDIAHYTGTQENKVKQYAGDLKVYEFSQSMGEVTCMKSNGRITSWIDLSDLEKVA